MKPFVLCADDYGIAPGVSAAIRTLLADRRLSATSCLVVSPHWKDEAPALRAFDDTADIGLHLALTQLRPLGPMPSLAPAGRFPGVGDLILRAFSGRLDRVEIGQEIDRQLDAFEAEMGRPPDYVDGHHHAQQLPVVREALLERFRTRLPEGTFVRVGAEPLGAILRRGVAPVRAGVIAAIGAGFGARVAAAGVSRNRRFSGVRSFTERAPYRDLFRRFIQDPSGGLEVMCHPGHPDAELAAVDEVTDVREGEFAYLSGPDFPTDIVAAGLCVGRFRELAAP